MEHLPHLFSEWPFFTHHLSWGFQTEWDARGSAILEPHWSIRPLFLLSLAVLNTTSAPTRWRKIFINFNSVASSRDYTVVEMFRYLFFPSWYIFRFLNLSIGQYRVYTTKASGVVTNNSTCYFWRVLLGWRQCIVCSLTVVYYHIITFTFYN